MKKIMKGLVCAVAAGCLLLGATSFSSSQISAKKTIVPAANQSTNISFVIQLKQAKLTHILGKKYQLSFSPASIAGGVLAVSRAPNRFFRRLSFTQFKTLVQSGTNSFLQDPPNAVLSGTEPLPFIATFNHKNLNNQYIIGLTSLDNNKHLTRSSVVLSNTTLFIDAYALVSDSSETEGGSCCCKGDTGLCFGKSYCNAFGDTCYESTPPVTDLP
jgi:hypothetical protein